MSTPNKTEKELLRLHKRLLLYKIACFVLAAIILGTGTYMLWVWRENGRLERNFRITESNIPYYKEVKKILEPLRYSGINSFIRPEVKLKIDFDSRKWFLRDFLRFDEDGNIILREGRYGLCSDLAVYVYQKIKPLFQDKYNIDFVRVAYSSFFPHFSSAHFVIRITESDISGPKAYIIDPSFGKYGPVEDFEDYEFFESSPQFRFAQEKNTDVSFRINASTPLVIKKDYLISLRADDINGVFDKDNLALLLTATRRYHYAGRIIYGIRIINGNQEITEDTYLAKTLLSKKDYAALKKKINEIFDNIVFPVTEENK
jgi:hypothetical protein